MGVNKGIYPSLGQEPPPTPASGGQVSRNSHLPEVALCPPLAPACRQAGRCPQDGGGCYTASSTVTGPSPLRLNMVR